jgi:hypothetical protein
MPLQITAETKDRARPPAGVLTAFLLLLKLPGMRTRQGPAGAPWSSSSSVSNTHPTATPRIGLTVN